MLMVEIAEGPLMTMVVRRRPMTTRRNFYKMPGAVFPLYSQQKLLLLLLVLLLLLLLLLLLRMRMRVCCYCCYSF